MIHQYGDYGQKFRMATSHLGIFMFLIHSRLGKLTVYSFQTLNLRAFFPPEE